MQKQLRFIKPTHTISYYQQRCQKITETKLTMLLTLLLDAQKCFRFLCDSGKLKAFILVAPVVLSIGALFDEAEIQVDVNNKVIGKLSRPRRTSIFWCAEETR
jgi:hypothetical protein